MKHVKLYEQFTIENPEYIERINSIINNKKLIKGIYSTYKSLPKKFQNIIKNYVLSDRIDIGSLMKVEKKYNIFNRVKKLYDKGIKDINKIINIIFPKNEGFVLVSTLLTICLIITTVLIIFGILWGFNYLASNEKPIWMLIIYGFVALIISISIIIFETTKFENLEKRVRNKEMRLEPEKKKKYLEKYTKEIKEITLDYGMRADSIILVMDENGEYKVKMVEKYTDW